mmetsp:Transcript_43900/g.110667  ORF Transcript_43900/g.110667 Transcript_43900/m.110667 type:complete len:202 (-) Transcript_43900:649-1254(-)
MIRMGKTASAEPCENHIKVGMRKKKRTLLQRDHHQSGRIVVEKHRSSTKLQVEHHKRVRMHRTLRPSNRTLTPDDGSTKATLSNVRIVVASQLKLRGLTRWVDIDGIGMRPSTGKMHYKRRNQIIGGKAPKTISIAKVFRQVAIVLGDAKANRINGIKWWKLNNIAIGIAPLCRERSVSLVGRDRRRGRSGIVALSGLIAC